MISTPGKPWHVWLTGIVGCLWHSLGALSFVLAQMNVEAVMSGFPPQQREYFASFPLWADASWAAGVVAGVIGCVLLLRRSHLAVHALVVSATATLVCNLGGLFLLGGLEVMNETGGLGFTTLPIAVATLLACYALAIRGRWLSRPA